MTIYEIRERNLKIITCIHAQQDNTSHKSRVGKLLAHRLNLPIFIWSASYECFFTFRSGCKRKKKRKSVTHENCMKFKFLSKNKALQEHCHRHIAYGSFCTTAVELSPCDEDVVCSAKPEIFNVCLLREKFADLCSTFFN